jgi:hypothetical protein
MVVISIKRAPLGPFFKLLQFSDISVHVNEMHIFNAAAKILSY